MSERRLDSRFWPSGQRAVGDEEFGRELSADEAATLEQRIARLLRPCGRDPTSIERTLRGSVPPVARRMAFVVMVRELGATLAATSFRRAFGVAPPAPQREPASLTTTPGPLARLELAHADRLAARLRRELVGASLDPSAITRLLDEAPPHLARAALARLSRIAWPAMRSTLRELLLRVARAAATRSMATSTGAASGNVPDHARSAAAPAGEAQSLRLPRVTSEPEDMAAPAGASALLAAVSRSFAEQVHRQVEAVASGGAAPLAVVGADLVEGFLTIEVACAPHAPSALGAALSPPAVRGDAPGAARGSDGAGSAAHEDEADRAADEALARMGSSAASVTIGASPSLPSDARAGRPMSPTVRQSFERGFGWDFGAVRLHADAPAADRTDRAGAAALTSGSDIYFGRGASDPEAAGNRRALAHELAHVVQQQLGAGAGRPLGGGAARSLTAAPLGAAQALPKVTGITVDTEIGLGKKIEAKALVAAGTKANEKLTWTATGAAVTVTKLDARRARITAPAAALKGTGGTTFTLEVALSSTPADKFVSPPIMLVEVVSAPINPAPAFTLGGAPAKGIDPNRDGVAGNTGNVVVTTAPAGRANTIKLTNPLGATLAGTVVTPGKTTGKQLKYQVTDDKTKTEFKDSLPVLGVPLRVTGFPSQLPAAKPGVYGALNTVGWAYSHGKADGRWVAEMITAGASNDFGIIPNGGWHVAPTMPFSAPANNWNDQNYTGKAHPKIDVNLYVGKGVPQLPRIMIFNQTFHWWPWSGAPASKQFDKGIHRRSLRKSGSKFIFRTEQNFPGGSALRNEPYAGPKLVKFKNVKLAPLVPAAPGATAVAADGVATGKLSVTTTVPANNALWTLVSGTGLTVPGAAVGGGAGVTVVSTVTPGTTKVKVTDAKYANRFGQGTVKTKAVELKKMTGPSKVKAGVLAANVKVTAAPGGRTVNFQIDPAALAGGVTVGPMVPAAGMTATTVINRPAAFKGMVTVTATDSVLAAKTATFKINFQ